MSRIIDLNDKLNNRAYNFYCLDSHNELCFILQFAYDDRIIYSEIYNNMVIMNNPINKSEKLIVKQVKNMIPLILEDWFNIE